MKIAIIRLSALGDILQTSIVLQFIKKHFDDIEIDWICEERFCKILQNHPLINEIITTNLKDKKIFKTIKTLLYARKKNYDLIIDFQGLLKSAFVAKILGKNCVGYGKIGIRKEKLATFFYSKTYDIPYEKNVILRYLDLASSALNFTYTKEEILDKNRCFPCEVSNENKKILIVVASSLKVKNYPPNLQIELIKLLKNYEIFLLWGNDEEKQIATFIANQTNAKILPKISLADLPKKICEFSLVIGADTGPTHLAFCQNIPSIAIFGPTSCWRNSYETPTNKTISAGKNVDVFNTCKDDFCIKNIAPQSIANLAKELLNG